MLFNTVRSLYSTSRRNILKFVANVRIDSEGVDWRYIEGAVYHAIDENDHRTANDLLDKILVYLRNTVLQSALRSAARANDIASAQEILKQNLYTTSLETPLSIACSRNHVEIVALTVNSLIRKDEEIIVVPRHLKEQRARVLERLLQTSIRNKSHSITAILLPPYLECATYFNTPSDTFTLNETPEKVRNEDYATISHQACFKMLSSKEYTDVLKEGCVLMEVGKMCKR